jgi:hypothetical protein
MHKIMNYTWQFEMPLVKAVNKIILVELLGTREFSIITENILGCLTTQRQMRSNDRVLLQGMYYHPTKRRQAKWYV